MKNRLLVLFLLLLPVTARCVPAPEEIPTPTITSTAFLPSPTVVWFPPTPTREPYPTLAVTPTPEMLIGIGDHAFQDDFSIPSPLWQSITRPSGQVVIASPELAIPLTGANGYLFSQRNNPVFGDFYLETTLMTSLCTGGDSFGGFCAHPLFRIITAGRSTAMATSDWSGSAAGAWGFCRIGPHLQKCCRVHRRPSGWGCWPAGTRCASLWMISTSSAFSMTPSPAAGWGSRPLHRRHTSFSKLPRAEGV